MDTTQAQILRDQLQGLEVGGWLIDGFHGNGKSAVVLPAQKGNQQGAIKIFHPELVERYGKEVQLERIMREKSLVGAVHDNLVQIYDGGECEVTGYLYVVMESLPYRNLHERLKEVPIEVVPKIIAQVASAARYLEDRGLAHRDIKPENIAISDDFSRAVLLDLGVLLPIGVSNLTDVDQRIFIGTLRYSSPEFLRREEEDTIEGWRAVTFYQIGAVLHDLLMKKVLFAEFSEPFPLLVEAVKSETPHIVSENNRAVLLATRCLVKSPATRLELVDWSDFNMVESQVSDALARLERINQRQRCAREAPTTGSNAGWEADRKLKHFLDDLTKRFETRVAALLNGAACFPLRTTRSEKSPEQRTCTVCLGFEQAPDLGLPYRLTILFEMTFIDENAGIPIFRAASGGALSNSELKSSALRTSSVFYVGDVAALLDGSPLEQVLLAYLEAAYQAGEQGRDPTGDALIHLAPDQ
ncbi:protein kinase domain-containing protein [Pseudomonas protegens]|uniref:protein kinase domain-containing protein n=2 Tax=Pseudomonas TaxID=286 RepID=UPI00215E0FCC|nr:protein kinase [Pseudomonas protegens]UVL70096.1 protein kinase [Pseudomonas protegens]